MKIHEPVHEGQQVANRQRKASQPTNDCGFCGQQLDGENTERVEHVLPTANGERSRRVRYCSPSCFIRDMEHTAGFSG